MDDWLDRFADALGVPRLRPEDADAVLDLARVVAHGTERKNAPLAAYLAGQWSASSSSSASAGDPRAAVARAEDLLGAEPPTPGRS